MWKIGQLRFCQHFGSLLPYLSGLQLSLWFLGRGGSEREREVLDCILLYFIVLYCMDVSTK